MADLSVNFAGIKSLNRFYPALVLLLFLAVAQSNAQQKVTTPNSKLIDAPQLLRDLQALSADDMQGRLVGTPGSAKAREYVLERFKASGIEKFGDSYLQPFEFSDPKKPDEKISGTNVVGFIKGKTAPEKYIVVTAHYDHLGVMDGKIYNGADDNASGTSALFALAAYFSKNAPANSIIFVAFDAEEENEQGSRKFVAAPPVKKESIVMSVNMDMISHSGAGELYASGTYHYPFLKGYLENVSKTAGVKLLFGHDAPKPPADDWTTQSDHYSFHKAKIPFVYFGVEDHKDYHKPTDDYETVTKEFYVQAVETILAAVKEFDANLAQIDKQKAALQKN